MAKETKTNRAKRIINEVFGENVLDTTPNIEKMGSKFWAKEDNGKIYLLCSFKNDPALDIAVFTANDETRKALRKEGLLK